MILLQIPSMAFRGWPRVQERWPTTHCLGACGLGCIPQSSVILTLRISKIRPLILGIALKLSTVGERCCLLASEIRIPERRPTSAGQGIRGPFIAALVPRKHLHHTRVNISHCITIHFRLFNGLNAPSVFLYSTAHFDALSPHAIKPLSSTPSEAAPLVALFSPT